MSEIITAKELSFVENNLLNEEQLKHLLKKTPKDYVRKRPAKGGGQWEYVTVGYVKKALNIMFGFDWDFQILDQLTLHGEVIVKGRLTCRVGNRTIVKEQFGNKDIICKKGTEIPLSIGNDMKSAASDCLKKCAAEIGIAADIYNKEEFKEVQVSTEDELFDKLHDLWQFHKETVKADFADKYEFISIVVGQKKTANYKKAIKFLEQL